ncbi:AbfB domain-containing protein [Streptomyces roseirectus]|uniref:AbfB domain-containing protein n=1 Tax=Streptomyces roseirectus TaxID=2768066 RepID=A0A7H0IKS0_9ACTN|nr:AbfB domain-containing protein [Streptomyces roseirectus]QNP73386.1 AbfB domain-containing protein [Streptomyces roseirectus]
MPFKKSRPAQQSSWENGWAPDTSRAPGTRRLWLAGALVLATVTACVTAITVMDQEKDAAAEAKQADTRSAKEAGPGLISFATPTPTDHASPAGGKGERRDPAPSGSPTPSTHPSASPSPRGDDGKDTTGGTGGKDTGATTPTPAAPPPAKPPARPATNPYDRSISAVNYPDRYWHVSDGLVKLDAPRGSESREDSTFTVVPGLAKNSCYSFKTHDGTYLRHRNFVLRAERNDGSSLFRQDATFCAGYGGSDAVLLTSVNYPNHALRHRNFQLRLDPWGYNTTNRDDFYFHVTTPLS